jgi:hypothetical protein
VQGSALRTFTESFDYVSVDGPSTSSLRGIFREQHITEAALLDERSVVSQKPMIDVLLSDLPTVPKRGDLVTIPRLSRTFEVDESQEDGEGMSKLLLVETS